MLVSTLKHVYAGLMKIPEEEGFLGVCLSTYLFMRKLSLIYNGG